MKREDAFPRQNNQNSKGHDLRIKSPEPINVQLY